jgi:hypothetical protein
MDLKSILSTYSASVSSCNFRKVELKLKSKIQKPVYQSTPARDSSENRNGRRVGWLQRMARPAGL